MTSAKKLKLIGPFSQLLTMNHMPMRGKLVNGQLEIIENGGIVMSNDLIVEAGIYRDLERKYKGEIELTEKVDSASVCLPGFIDAHTHICFAGSRHMDYSARKSGKSYLDIAKEGGGIKDTVNKTRHASDALLFDLTLERADMALKNGITTIEVKSGYGLDYAHELRHLSIIQKVGKHTKSDIIPTCLAAHVVPLEFQGNAQGYLEYVVETILPEVKSLGLANRVDIFIEKEAFDIEMSRIFLKNVLSMGFDITIHADQFNPGGSLLGVELGALSVDHLEASGQKEIAGIAKSETVATVLPGASIGLGVNFAPARKLLDAGGILAIASDWNPGSAPMGDLLTQAAILGSFEMLSDAEVFAGMTFRAAKALKLKDRGVLRAGYKADFIAFEGEDYREILYHQGQLKPGKIWKDGLLI